MIGGTDARQHQKARRTDGAGGHDHFAPGAQDFPSAAGGNLDADRAAPFDKNPQDQRVAPQGEIGATQGRLQIGGRGRRAPDIVLRHLVVADTFLAGAVEVGIAPDARLDRGREEGLADRQGRARIGHAQRTAAAVIFVVKAGIALGPLEIGKHFAIAPAGAARLRPEIVV